MATATKTKAAAVRGVGLLSAPKKPPHTKPKSKATDKKPEPKEGELMPRTEGARTGRVSGTKQNKGNAPKPAQNPPIDEAQQSVDDMIERDTTELRDTQPTAAIIETAKTVQRLEAEVEVLQGQIENKNAEIKRLVEQVLPPAMDSLQLKQFLLDDGTQVERDEAIYASISKENAIEAARWLEKNGFGSIVKAKIVVEFERGDHKLASVVRALLVKAKIGYEETAGVHNATLKAFVRESVEKGRKLPSSITHHVQPVAVLRVKKERKKSAPKPQSTGGNDILR